MAASVSSYLLALGAGLACGADAGAEPQPGATAYEGPNFYEPGEPANPPAPTASVMPGGLPGFVGFVGGDGGAATCSAATARESVATDQTDATLACQPIVRAAISDFAFVGGDGRGVTFGASSDVRGGTFFYPDGPGALSSDVTGGDWHLSGTVSSTSGFGLYMSGCSQLDASVYGGVQFSVWGSVGAGGSLVFFVGTAANQVSHAWINANGADTAEPPNLGRCIPVTNRYDGTCTEPRTAVPVTEARATVQVAWRTLANGCPEPSVNPREVTSIAWYFPQSPSGAYDIDIHIDDLHFTDASPL